MKIELNEEASWAVIVLAVCIVIITISIGGFINSNYRAKLAFENGLEEVPDYNSSTHYGHK